MPGALTASLLVHALAAAAVALLPVLFPPPVVTLGGGQGGGRGGDVVRVGLTASLDGGSGELFKPALSPAPPVPEAPPAPAARESPAPLPPAPDAFDVASRRRRSPPAPRPPPPAPPSGALPSNVIPREPVPGAGGAGRSAGAGGGFGGGVGVQIGSGAGEGAAADSWYARLVERRIGENWLRTNFEALAGRRISTVIRFDILPDGTISDVVVQQRSGVTFYDLAAERAVRSSSPLPRPPAEFLGRTVRFVCYFQYPPEGT